MAPSLSWFPWVVEIVKANDDISQNNVSTVVFCVSKKINNETGESVFMDIELKKTTSSSDVRGITTYLVIGLNENLIL
jgi:hypothetical protein